MDGFLAYKFYLAIKLHFTSDSYDVFKSKGRVRATYESYLKRNDKGLFDALCYKFPQEKEYIQYIASNFMYGHPNVIYDSYDDGLVLYMRYIKRKQSITRVFADDLTKLTSYDCGDIFEAYLKNVITLESMVILDSIENVCDNVQNVLVEDQIRLIRKSRGFVKFDNSKIVTTYLNFLKEI